jgi:hypothetical protein
VRIHAAALLLLSAGPFACSPATGTSAIGPPTPSFPVVPSPQPPAVDILGPWSGTDSDSIGSGAVTLNAFQDGGVVTGSGTLTEDQQRGFVLAGTLSGSTLYFNLTYGVNCVRSVSGTLAADDATMSGTFSGTNQCGGNINNGQVSLTTQRPALSGTWSGVAPAILGAGNWTWQVQQAANAITASVTIQTNNLHETDALGGTMVWAEGHFAPSFSFSISGCPGVTVTASVTQNINAASITSTQINGQLTLSTNSCLGPFFTDDFVLDKQ